MWNLHGHHHGTCRKIPVAVEGPHNHHHLVARIVDVVLAVDATHAIHVIVAAAANTKLIINKGLFYQPFVFIEREV